MRTVTARQTRQPGSGSEDAASTVLVGEGRFSNRRPESERGLRVVATPRRQPDLELLARVIVDMAMTDPLGLHPTTKETAAPDLDQRDTHR